MNEVISGAAPAAPIKTASDPDPDQEEDLRSSAPTNERLSAAAWLELGRSLAATHGHEIRKDHLGRLGTKLAADSDVREQDNIVQ